MKKTIFLFILGIGLGSCSKYFVVHDRQSKSIAVTDSLPSSELSQKIAGYLNPLHDTLDARMNGVLVQSSKRLSKGQPESELGNLLSDMMLETAREQTGKNIDIALTNNGGIRAELPAGGITLGNVYEVMPFDNEMVILTLSGANMQKLIDYIAVRKDPQAGLKLIIEKTTHKVLEVSINGQPFDISRNYMIATSDYVANGGDKAEFLKDRIAYDKMNLLLRDCYIDYFKKKGQKGEVINPKLDGRTKVQ